MINNNAKIFLEEFFKINRCLKDKTFYKNDLTQLSILQLHALIFLKENDHAQMTEIANHFKIELSSATSLLNKLCSMALAIREVDDKDRRIVRILLTQKGKNLLKDAMEERIKKIEAMFAYLSEEDTNEFLRILKVLNKRLASSEL